MILLIVLVLILVVIYLIARSRGGSGGEHKQDEYFDLKGPGKFDVGIVGESHYQTALRDVLGSLGRNEECQAELLCEDNNPYDSNAVAVFIRGHKVGYLSREVAPVYRAIIRKGGFGRATGKCRARLFGGTKSKPSIGVWIDI
jgi:hypothetical protein